MFQFRRFPSYSYGFTVWYMVMTPCGLLHSEICGSKLAYSSPQLIAVNHVLLRLPMPRHSPCALVRFTFRDCSLRIIWFWLLVVFTRLDYFQCASSAHSFLVSRFCNLSITKLRSFLIFALHLLFSFQGTPRFDFIETGKKFLAKFLSLPVPFRTDLKR